MPLPRALGRFNRRVTNRLLGPVLTRLPGFGYVVHVGRRSGRVYRTPVLAFRKDDRIVFALTYGPGADWAMNVMAAGGCRFEPPGGATELTLPRLFRDPSRRPVPAVVRPALWLLGAADFLELRRRDRDNTNLQRIAGRRGVDLRYSSQPREEISTDDRRDAAERPSD